MFVWCNACFTGRWWSDVITLRGATGRWWNVCACIYLWSSSTGELFFSYFGSHFLCCMSNVSLHVSLRKSTSEIELQFLVFFTSMNYIYVNKEGDVCVSVWLLVWKKAPIRTRIIGIFHFHLLFLKTLIKNIIYCQTVHVFVQFTDVLVCKKVCQASLSSFLLLTIFCLDLCQMEIACSTEHLWNW